jgi:hypothetical protein
MGTDLKTGVGPCSIRDDPWLSFFRLGQQLDSMEQYVTNDAPGG